jgi:hypothetical protein
MNVIIKSVQTSPCRVFKVVALTGILFLFSAHLFASPIDTRQYQWKRIRTEFHDVIFPDFLEDEGRYVSSALQFMLPRQMHSLPLNRLRRYPVVLSPDSMAPNGFVLTGPRRSVFYTLPSTDMPGDWLTDLAVHEGRHMLQLDALESNTIRALSFLYGELASLLIIGMPYWWLEGDAVMAETVFTKSGRGRDPGFTAQFKALLLEDKVFEYNKLLLGSDKHHLPDFYEFGYVMNAWLRSTYDFQAPSRMFREYSRFPFPALGGPLALKKASGKGATALYEEMANAYGSFWKDQVASLALTPVTTASKPAASKPAASPFTRHSHLTILADGTLIAAREDLHRGNEIIMIQDGVETVLATGKVHSSLSSGGRLVAWDELVLDNKYDKSRTRIVLFNLDQKKKSLFIRSSGFLEPRLSPDGLSLALIEWHLDGRASLLILSTTDGRELSRVALPKGVLLSDLSFSTDGKTLVGIANSVAGGTATAGEAGLQGKSLCRIDPVTGTLETLFEAGFENIRNPVEYGEGTLYGSNYSGIDTIYFLDSLGKRFQVLVRPIGAYSPQPSASGQELFFIDYAGSRGTVISSAPLALASWTALEDAVVIREDFFKPVAALEPSAGSFIPENIPLNDVPAEDFSMLRQGNRITAWGILPGGDSGQGIQLFLHNRNIAQIQESAVMLTYDHGYKTAGLSYEYRYKGLLPDLVLRASSGYRNLDSEAFNESLISAGLEIPFGGGSPGSLSWSCLAGAFAGIQSGKSGLSFPLRGELGFSLNTARWHLGLQSIYEFEPSATSRAAHLYAGSTMTLPGLWSSQSSSISVSYEDHPVEGSSYSTLARGYQEKSGAKLFSAGLGYSMPLVYPDLALGSILYIPRISLDPFLDYAYALDTGVSGSSVGADLLMHFHALQLPFRLTSGLRVAWLLETREPVVQFLLMGMAF